MLVYGHRTFRLNTNAALRDAAARIDRLSRTPDHDAIVTLLVDWGELESAVADRLSPDRDDEIEALEGWRTASDAIADVVVASWAVDHRRLQSALHRAGRNIAALSDTPFPDDVVARTAEGFAHYALYPEQYITAAAHFVAAHRPAHVLCIGLRSIGSILAHIVGATLRQHGVATLVRSVRPRGHPFERRLSIGDRLRTGLAASSFTHAAVVDEGPGISGSSFAAAADFACSLGFAASRVVLFPSWSAPASVLRSAGARATWRRHPRLCVDFDTLWLNSGRLFGHAGAVEDLSAGRWRPAVLDAAAEWPAVQPQHERRKYLVRVGEPMIHRFAGLGRRGHAMARRAEALASAGFCAGARRLSHGFLEQRWIDGRPLTTPTADHVRRIAAFIAHVKRSFGTGEADTTAEVREMAAINVCEATDAGTSAAFDRLADAARHFSEERVAIDGRLLPHEWIVSGTRLFKTDALDHHDDDFWPGCRDIAWDVAGAIVEFDWAAEPRERFVAEYTRESGDRTIRLRLAFYEAAYAAYRVGYATMAAESLTGSADGDRFTLLAARYRRSLASRLACSRRG